MEVYIIMGMAILIYTFVSVLINSECWSKKEQRCKCEECASLCHSFATLAPPATVSSRIDIVE